MYVDTVYFNGSTLQLWMLLLQDWHRLLESAKKLSGQLETHIKLYQNLLKQAVQLVPILLQVRQSLEHSWHVTKSDNMNVPEGQEATHVRSTL